MIELPRTFAGRRVTVMGLGTHGGGAGATRYLCRRGAIVTLTDRRSAEELKKPLAELGCEPAATRLGSHDPADFTNAELIVASPAVPHQHELLIATRSAGATVTTQRARAHPPQPAPRATRARTRANRKSNTS
ncbi:MAG: hypothetical protein AAF907_14940, partial [Planctomycetota bacterium]